MLTIQDNELVFTFPDVNASAEMRVSFRRADPDEPALLNEPIDAAIPVASAGRLVMHLRPKIVFEQGTGQYRQDIRYPFAVLVTFDGINALTGDYSTALSRTRQNYFASPPQGGIDGYFVRGSVHPFRGVVESLRQRARLDIKVFPMKSEMWGDLMHRRNLTGWHHPAIQGLTLAYGGERQCEPVYEDICCLGDWDQSNSEIASVWLRNNERD
jgi:hypothetical protein